MAEMATTLALRSEGLDGLCARLSLQKRRHPEFPQLVLLKYSMTSTPMNDPVSRQCRGLIVDESDDFRPVAYPYDKFFNHREGHAAPIDWPTARVLEKVDGVLCTLYPHGGRWHVATMTNPDAQGLLRGRASTLAEAFWETFRAGGYRLPERADHCFMFELCLPTDPILVRHERPRLLVHGARDLTTLCEVKPDPFAAELGWELVASHPLADLASALRAARALDPTKTEGFVACDEAFRRVKIKSPAFVALHHMRGALNLRHLLEVVRANEGDEFLAYFPEARPAWEAVGERYRALRAEAEAELARGAGMDDREFGRSVRHLEYNAMLFQVRKGKAATVAEALAEAPIQGLERQLGLGELSRRLGIPVEPRGGGSQDDG